MEKNHGNTNFFKNSSPFINICVYNGVFCGNLFINAKTIYLNNHSNQVQHPEGSSIEKKPDEWEVIA
jgi:hypothetical protein